jgi:hypothetical protein
MKFQKQNSTVARAIHRPLVSSLLAKTVSSPQVVLSHRHRALALFSVGFLSFTE